MGLARSLSAIDPQVAAPKRRVRVKEEDFMRRLTEKLTHFDASLVLEAAMLSAGVSRSEGFPLGIFFEFFLSVSRNPQ